MTATPSEKDVVTAWQKRICSGVALTTGQGEPVEIVYPGRHNDSQGADFRDAVITFGGRLMKGDIEVHVRSRDWTSHRHHLDPVYNRVILHVVWWHDSGVPTSLCNGDTVPVLALSDSQEVPCPALTLPYSCDTSRVTTETLAGFLDQAGDERFLAKSTEFKVALAEKSAGQILYRGIMGALGYSRNQIPCLELADRLPLATLESVASETASDEECVIRLQALLLGTAGLLPSQRGAVGGQTGQERRYVRNLERLWSSYRNGPEMSPGMWHLSCTRPHNSPPRRLVAMSCLITRYRREGLLYGLWGQYVGNVPSPGDWRRMEEGLTVSVADHWGIYSGSGTARPVALGAGRASDIMVNILLPFTYAWSQLNGRPELADAALDAYRDYPKLADNALLRHMRSQLRIKHSVVGSARRQQGLLRIYRTLCTQGRCGSCPLFPSGRGNAPEAVLRESEVGNDIHVEAVALALPELEVATGGNHGGVIGTQYRWRDMDRER